MGTCEPHAFVLRTGERGTVRAAEPGDASALLEHTRGVVSEASRWNITTPQEFDFTLEQELAWLDRHRVGPGSLVLVAEVDGRIVGFIDFANGSRRRLAHRGTLGMSVARDWRGRGVGDALLGVLLDWARANPLIEKVCLAVVADNERALALYRKHGFCEEGRRLREIRYEDGEFRDDVLMYRFVGRSGHATGT